MHSTHFMTTGSGIMQWHRSVIKSEGSGSLMSSHQSKSRPKFVFVLGTENELFGYFWLFSFAAENGISFSSTFSFMVENEKCIFDRPLHQTVSDYTLRQ